MTVVTAPALVGCVVFIHHRHPRALLYDLPMCWAQFDDIPGSCSNDYASWDRHNSKYMSGFNKDAI